MTDRIEMEPPRPRTSALFTDLYELTCSAPISNAA